MERSTAEFVGIRGLGEIMIKVSEHKKVGQIEPMLF